MRKYKKQLLGTGLDSSKNASTKVRHKTGELLGYKVAYALANSNDDKIVKTKL